jgi:hypothetical protein
MSITMRSLAMLLACLACSASFAQGASKRIRGDVVAIDGQKLQVASRTGEPFDVVLDDKYVVTAVVEVPASAIVRGSYVGTATLPTSDGGQRALEVLVFPESARGSGEGHYAWDLQPGSMMTNATVAEVVNMDRARRMTLKYKDGEKVITVPEGVPIVTFQPGERAMLKPGAHVFLSATQRPDGTLTATRVTVGKDGLVPPM